MAAKTSSKPKSKAPTPWSGNPEPWGKALKPKQKTVGASLTGLHAVAPTKKKAAAPPTRSPATHPAAAPARNIPPPFLTPAEIAAQQKSQGAYQDRIGNINPDSLAGAAPDQITQALINGGGTLGQSLASGQSKFTQGMGNAQQSHDITTDNANQVMAARGLFQSSIRDGDLNDIDATLAARQSTLNTAWSSLQTRIGTAYNQAVRDAGVSQSYYNGLAVQNAQAADTGMAGPSTPAAPAAPAAGAGPTPTGPPIPQGQTTHQSPAKPPAFGGVSEPWGKSLSLPKPPKPPAFGGTSQPWGKAL